MKLPIFSPGDEAPNFVYNLDAFLSVLVGKNALSLPDLSHFQTLAVLSDYSDKGDPGSSFHTYSFYVTGFAGLHDLEVEFARIRDATRVGRSFDFSYKQIKEAKHGEAVERFLDLVSRRKGIVFVALIPRSVTSVFGPDRSFASDYLSQQGLAPRKVRVGEATLRILFLVSYWASILGSPNQQLLWMTDKDDIIAKPELADEAPMILDTLTERFRSATFRKKGFAQRFIADAEANPPFLNDLLSIPDLFSAFVGRTVTQCSDRTQLSLKPGAGRIMSILKCGSLPLATCVTEMHLEGGGTPMWSRLLFS